MRRLIYLVGYAVGVVRGIIKATTDIARSEYQKVRNTNDKGHFKKPKSRP